MRDAREISPAPARDQLTALTGVRAFAAFGPVLAHSFGFINVDTPIVWHGYLGVDFFFMLSGFVLAYVHAEEMQRFTWPRYARFLGLRLGRIWPAYAAILVLIAISMVRHGQLGAPEQQRFLLHFLMMQNWGIISPNEFNWPGWSVSAEWFVYLLFPLFALCFSRANRLVALALIPVLIVVLALAFVAFGAQLSNNNVPGLGRAVLEFAVGILLWRLFRDPTVRQWNWPAIGAVSLIAIVALVIAMRPGLIVDIVFIALFAPLLLSLALARGPFAKICAWRPVVFLGEISYSLYLVHFVVLLKINSLLRDMTIGDSRLIGTVIFVGAAIGASLIAAIALHYVVERPCRRWVRHRLGYA